MYTTLYQETRILMKIIGKKIEKGLKDIYETTTIEDKTPPPSPKKEGIGVPDNISEMTDNDPNNFNFYRKIKEKYPIEMRHIIIPTIKEEKNVKYQILSEENTDIPPMFIGYCKIKKPLEDDIYIGTTTEMAKEAIIVQPGIANDDQIMIMNISNKKFEIRRGQKIANDEKKRIKILEERCLQTEGPGVWELLGPVLTKYIDTFREKDEYATHVDPIVIEPVKIILKEGVDESKIPWNMKAQKKRKYSQEELEIIRKMRDDLLKNGIIFSGNTDWRSPCIVIEKNDGTKKIAIDYRILNTFLLLLRELLPDTKQMLQKISMYKHYITMDIKSAYWQILVHEDSRKYTATEFADFGTYC
ncbi:10108_t:CDS:2 [Ambispora leptoticha]|uniref:10108_t:CDS:1 n=1 Tax=Ambispora leptoticha TaxID=144679 RepID=A0A9N9E7J4_9GLOM|nr:10108_t:CDS:2 [Ambispora leptoticha]